MKRNKNPLGEEILAELESLTNLTGERYSLNKLAYDAGTNPSTLSKHCSGEKKASLEMVMRYVAVLAPSADRADVILRSAGYDITYDHDVMCPNYRAIRDYTPAAKCTEEGMVADINALFGKDEVIYRRYNRNQAK